MFRIDFKCWDPYVSPGCMIRLAFFWVFHPCFCMLILSHLSKGPVPSLPLLALGSVYVGKGSTTQYHTICWKLDLISGFFFFSWLIVWEDGINKCGWCLAGGRGFWLKGLHQIPSVSSLLYHSLHFHIY